MNNILADLIRPNSNKSSSRAINIVGAITATAILIFDTVMRGMASPELLGVYLAYCAGTYGLHRVTAKTTEIKETNGETNDPTNN